MRNPALLIALAAAIALPAETVVSQPAPAAISYQYADLADLALAAPLVVSAEIKSTTTLKRERAVGVPEGFVRLYVEADVAALIRGADGVPARIVYLLDVPTDSRGRPPKLRKQRVLVLARPVAGRPGEVQLVAPDAQLPWSAETEARLRAILTEAIRADSPPEITGIGNAFHVPGTLPGEGETQIFLTTADDRPVSLNILRRPNQEARWAVALSEIVDEAAEPPARDTLLWYRLACTLPATLPASALENAAPEQIAMIERDYQVVMEGLGPCARDRKTPAA
jgi:hypothetical protein